MSPNHYECIVKYEGILLYEPKVIVKLTHLEEMLLGALRSPDREHWNYRQEVNSPLPQYVEKTLGQPWRADFGSWPGLAIRCRDVESLLAWMATRFPPTPVINSN